jgi:hypothetical protein
LKIIEYDNIDEWGTWFDELISQVGPSNMIEILSQSTPEYIEDAANILYQHIDKKDLVDHLNVSLKNYFVRVYHGTRLSSFDLEKIKSKGLRPLDLIARKGALVDIFKDHPEWQAVESNLNEVLAVLGPGNQQGLREDGGVHVCFSRQGLIEGCPHYLKYGAEVDTHVAYRLFDDKPAALNLLEKNRQPYLISFILDFNSALSSADPYGFSDELPSLIKLLVEAWSYKKYDSEFSTSSLVNTTAAMFEGEKPADELEKYEKLTT